MDPERAIDIAAAIAAGLAAAHAKGIIHRDVKPANVLIAAATGTVKVADFGIARAADDAQDGLTMPGAVMGTATYLSPEQAQGRPVDARSDIYSLGMVLYEMLTGKAPFKGDSPVAVAYKQLHEIPPTPSALNPAVSPALDALVAKALSKDPDQRPSSATEFRAELLAIGEDPVPAAAAAVSDATLVDAPAGGGTHLDRVCHLDPPAPDPAARRRPAAATGDVGLRLPAPPGHPARHPRRRRRRVPAGPVHEGRRQRRHRDGPPGRRPQRRRRHQRARQGGAEARRRRRGPSRHARPGPRAAPDRRGDRREGLQGAARRPPLGDDDVRGRGSHHDGAADDDRGADDHRQAVDHREAGDTPPPPDDDTPSTSPPPPTPPTTEPPTTDAPTDRLTTATG